MQSRLADSFLQARNFHEGRTSPVSLIVLHTDEASERPDNAENVAKFFATTDRDASAHYCCDNNSIVCCVKEEDVAFGAPHVNHNGIHIEQSGDAAQRAREWEDDFSQTMLRTQVAPLVADIARRHAIPIKHLTNDELRRGARGIIGHSQASQVFGGTHTDPGSDYPWGFVISRARALAVTKKFRLAMFDGEGNKLAHSVAFEMKDIGLAWTSFTKNRRPEAVAELKDVDSGRDISIRVTGA